MSDTRQITQELLIQRGSKEMPSTKIQAFLKEFPWVKERVGLICEVYVSRITPEIISRRLQNSGWDNEFGFLIDRFGNLVTETDSSVLEQYDSIEGKLKEIGDRAKLVRFVLSYHQYTKAVIVYKVPQGISIIDWIQQQVESEQRKIRKECKSIDLEPRVSAL